MNQVTDVVHPTWKEAPSMIGKLTLVELKHVDATGRAVLYEQTYGIITQIDRKEGIWIELHGAQAGKKLALPADLKKFGKAPRGMYKLETTGEEIEDPDYFSTWVFQHKDQVNF
ncbi:MAG: hypothetical protein JSR45_10400 [Proteobacteria bacterium]|nr:hypothetical protein [Pseudomonadota bacterium]